MWCQCFTSLLYTRLWPAQTQHFVMLRDISAGPLLVHNVSLSIRSINEGIKFKHALKKSTKVGWSLADKSSAQDLQFSTLTQQNLFLLSDLSE